VEVVAQAAAHVSGMQAHSADAGSSWGLGGEGGGQGKGGGWGLEGGGAGEGKGGGLGKGRGGGQRVQLVFVLYCVV
jgi:hypothetical protein